MPDNAFIVADVPVSILGRSATFQGFEGVFERFNDRFRFVPTEPAPIAPPIIIEEPVNPVRQDVRVPDIMPEVFAPIQQPIEAPIAPPIIVEEPVNPVRQDLPEIFMQPIEEEPIHGFDTVVEPNTGATSSGGDGVAGGVDPGGLSIPDSGSYTRTSTTSGDGYQYGVSFITEGASLEELLAEASTWASGQIGMDEGRTISAQAQEAKLRGEAWGIALCEALDALDPGHCEKALQNDFKKGSWNLPCLCVSKIQKLRGLKCR